MAHQEHLDILNQGVEVWNQWREENKNIRPDLNGANLCYMNLSQIYVTQADQSEATPPQVLVVGINLSGTDLIGTTLIKSFLRHANLSRANLSGAILDGTDLYGATLYEANLNGAFLGAAEFGEANLSETDLSDANLIGANLSYANLFRANLSRANLSSTILVRTNCTEAILTDCRIFGISAWDVKLEGTSQNNLIITPEEEPTITVDDLEVAQFIYLLLNNPKIRDVINTIGQKGVLLLGRFGDGGLEFLHAIAAKLREMNYLPIIFDFERPDHRDFTETIMTLAGLSRFVIADISGSSVPNELRSTIPYFKIPFVPIIEQGAKIYSMFPDLLLYPWVLAPVEFTSKGQLIELLPSRVIEPAEEKFKEVQVLLEQLFNR
jgi:uncharacterized protein YjbI with pentapeptide repeats